MNMALDEVLWASATKPALRIYQWDHPALSFGYFGQYKDVAQYTQEREIVRRCTGGGIVFHGVDLTYALVIPASERVNSESSVAIYGFVHRAIMQTLSASDIRTTLVEKINPGRFAPRDAERGAATGACFANPVPADVMIGEQKIAGAAQRRSRGGLLQQGSIQHVPLPPDFGDQFAHELCSNVVPSAIAADRVAKAAQLSQSKYAAEHWLKRR